jgi:AcrR family transcriptional regulator
MAEVDGRRERGERTRRAVAEQAAALASLEGLAGVTLARVAEALGTSKSSIQAAYPTKEAVQLAAIDAATRTFVREVVGPAQTRPEGASRLWALVDAWLDYVERRVFPGGCFMVANLADYDSRPGPVRDALARARTGWLAALEHEVRAAQEAGAIASTPAARLVAFEIDALLSAANVDRNFHDDTRSLADARKLIAMRLGVAAPRRRARHGAGP